MVAGTHQHHVGETDAALVMHSVHGDIDAFEELFRRHAHPAWRLAIAIAGSRAGATDAVVEGFSRALLRARKAGAPPASFRVAVARATRVAALHRDLTAGAQLTVTPPNALAAAFRELPERWRTVLWLIQVEGGSPAQAAAIIELEPEATAALAARAVAGLRERFLEQERQHAPEACRAALDALTIDPHAQACPDCRQRAALLADPRRALTPLVGAMPAGLLTTANNRFDRWREAEIARERRRLAWVGPVAPWAEKALAGAAAAVVGVGLLGASLLAGRGDRAPELAAPPPGEAPILPDPGDDDDGLPDASEVLAVELPSTGAAAASRGTGGSRSPTSGGDGMSSGALVPGPVASPVTPSAPTVTPPPASGPSPTPGTAGVHEGPGVDAAVNLGGTPVAVSLGADNSGIQLGDTVVGEPASQGTGVVLNLALLPRIDLTPVVKALGLV